jgi:hypothetical protein
VIRALLYSEIRTSLPWKSIWPLRKKEIIKDEKIMTMSNRTCINILKENLFFMQIL